MILIDLEKLLEILMIIIFIIFIMVLKHDFEFENNN